ncbi:MAG: class I SAM-dependent methyltransferase [Lachnospiraceae bacterium]|nr:class I SAM-dependent methyltransferase [Lachnospiraceae bacterium]
MDDKLLHIQTEEIQTDGKDTYHFHRYEPTPYEVLERLFNVYIPSSSDVAVDFGCGLGRLNFYLEHRFGLRSVGVEMSEHYYKRALENLQNYNGNRDHISFVHKKAEEYAVSKEETLFYFFNPFSLNIFRRVLQQILLSWQEALREITLLIYYPEDDLLFYLERHTSFHLKAEIAASDDIRSDRRERFCIYTLSAF